jgi:citrate lyase subunit gamma (acyl carrier protein)
MATVYLDKGKQGLEIEIHSPALEMFGKAIEDATKEVLAELRVENALVQIQDRGALDFTVRARVEAAARRALALKKGV